MLNAVLWVKLLICFADAFKAFDLFWVMLPNQDHTSIVSTLLVKEFLRFDNPGYGATLAELLTLLVFATAGIVFAAKQINIVRRGP